MKKLLLTAIITLITVNVFATFADPCTESTGNNCSEADGPITASSMGLSYTSCEGGCDLTFLENPSNCSGAATGDMYFVEIQTTADCSDIVIDVNSVTGDNSQATAMLFTSVCLNDQYSFVDAQCVGSGGQLSGTNLASGSYFLAFGGGADECVTFNFDISITTAGTPPSNDDCTSPTTMTAGDGIDNGNGTADAINGTTACATHTCTQTLCTDGPTADCWLYDSMGGCALGNVSGGETRCWGSIENSIFYQFTAPTTDTYFIQLINQSCNTNGLQFLVTSTLDCSNAENTANGLLNDVNGDPACVNQNTILDVYVEVALTGGQTYYIIIDGFAGAECSFDLITGTVLNLPVHWGKLGAEKISDTKAKISWEVHSDDEDSDFYVYASRNVNDVPEDHLKNLNFEMIGSVKSKKEIKNYEFYDNRLQDGFNFYYIAKADKYGRMKYRSKNIQMYNKTNINNVYINNSSNDKIILNWNQSNDTQVNVRMFDITGKHTLNENIKTIKGANNYEINTSSFKSGIYYISLEDVKGNKNIQKIIINK